MIKRTSQALCVWFICIDLVLTLLAWVAAYGLRFVEVMTRRSLDARGPLPRWVGEWAIW